MTKESSKHHVKRKTMLYDIIRSHDIENHKRKIDRLGCENTIHKAGDASLIGWVVRIQYIRLVMHPLALSNTPALGTILCMIIFVRI